MVDPVAALRVVPAEGMAPVETVQEWAVPVDFRVDLALEDLLEWVAHKPLAVLPEWVVQVVPPVALAQPTAKSSNGFAKKANWSIPPYGNPLAIQPKKELRLLAPREVALWAWNANSMTSNQASPW